MAENNYGLASGVGRPLMARYQEETTSGRNSYGRKPGSGRAWIGGGVQGHVPFMPLPAWFSGTYKEWFARQKLLAEQRPKSVRPKGPAIFKPPGGDWVDPVEDQDDDLGILPLEEEEEDQFPDPIGMDLKPGYDSIGIGKDLYIDPDPYPIRPYDDSFKTDPSNKPENISASYTSTAPPGGSGGEPVGEYSSMTDQAWKCMKNPSLPECKLQGSQRSVI